MKNITMVINRLRNIPIKVTVDVNVSEKQYAVNNTLPKGWGG